MITFNRLLIALVVAVGAIVIGSFSFYWIRSHWYTDIRPIFFGKVITDPDDPKFDPMQFRFEYYRKRFGNEWDLPKALLKMFPPGTDKTYFDKVLLDQAGAETQIDPQGFLRIGYQWPSIASLGGIAMGVHFDQNNKSTTFFIGANRLYESKDYKETMGLEMRKYTERFDREHPQTYLENIMRPIRKKYLGIEDGFIK